MVANSSVYVAVHGAAEVLLLALPPPAVAVQLMPYKFDDSHLYYHTFANWAAAAARSMLVWHNTNVWHTSPGKQRPPPLPHLRPMCPRFRSFHVLRGLPHP